jgi:butyryl-CoA dehydrogenase
MLLFQKSVVEGSLSLLLYCGLLSDLVHVSEGDNKERYELLLDLLTPIAKTYPSEMCCQTTSAAVQILGGAGYTTDFPVEQFYREARIHPIHEGTTGIHGMDLLGRKITIKQGRSVQLLMEEITATLVAARAQANLQNHCLQLEKALGKVQQVTAHLLSLAPENVEAYLADATLYLEMFGLTVLSWQWLKQAVVAQESLANDLPESERNFYNGKLACTRYFFEYELVKTESLSRRLLSNDRITIEMEESWF